MRALGDSRTPLIFRIVACLLNVAMDLIFVRALGLGVFGAEPHYVIRLDVCHNRVVVGNRQEAFSKAFAVNGMKWMGWAERKDPLVCRVKIRSTGEPLGPVTLEDGICRAGGEGLFGVAPGQSAVFYDEADRIIGGGEIAAI